MRLPQVWTFPRLLIVREKHVGKARWALERLVRQPRLRAMFSLMEGMSDTLLRRL